jgi:protein-disulfide isomerase
LLVVWKNIDMTRDPNIANALMAAQCAAEAGHFEEFHRSAFANAAVLDFHDGWIRVIAGAAVSSADSLRSCVMRRRFRQRVDDDTDEAVRIGVESTPTWFLNGRPFVGAPSRDVLDSLVGLAIRQHAMTTRQ